MSEDDDDVVVPNTPVAALIPHDTVSGRALMAVIAILTFLACLCAGGGVLLAASTSAWRSDVSREITIQVRPHAGADTDAEVNKLVMIASASPAVATVNAMSRADTEKSLAPWLGAGLDLSQLPIPRLVALLAQAAGLVTVDSGPAHAAAAVGCPQVVLFGKALPSLYRPWGIAGAESKVLCGQIDGVPDMLGIRTQDVIDAWADLKLREG